LTTGIFGTRYLLDALSRERRPDIVQTIVDSPEFPGWGHMLEQGATTLWEHWQFSDNTYSHNHPMFGSVSQWFYNWLGGIEPDTDAFGFDKFSFHPQFLNGLDWVNCSHQSIRGPIVCNWKRDGDSIAIELQVPVNSTARLVLPADGVLTEGGQPASDSDGVEFLITKHGLTEFRLASGQYRFGYIPPDNQE
jgi:alpha-L-rhamnosidase